MSSHREAPEISMDPVADNTDTYCFVSPDRPDTVTIITNYIPLEAPFGGPNFFEFGEDVLYRINVDNTGDGKPDVVYEFRFKTNIRRPDTFLYNVGQIDRVDSQNWNRPQRYSVTEVRGDRRRELGDGLFCPPCNVGVRSTPNYAALANSAIYTLDDGIKVFAGQRLEGFYVDLGPIFDLAGLRPFQDKHVIRQPKADGVDSLRAFNVHTIAIQVPIPRLTRDGRTPTDPMKPESVIGVWGSAYRQKARFRDESRDESMGPWTQVSRLGMPLFNEVIVPMSRKDLWNAVGPDQDFRFARYVARPELARLLPGLYPDVFPNLKAYTKERADLLAILLTGIPAGVVQGFQNFTGTRQADLLRLNLAIPPTPNPNPIGLIAGDPGGFPNGRRLMDNVVAIELRAVAGATIPLVDATFTPDAAAGLLTDGTSNTNLALLPTFPYMPDPAGGFQSTPGTPAA
jgi:Domain of unknown function (DUF4331)